MMQTSASNNEVSFRSTQIGIILYPDYHKVRGSVENFEQKVRILDEFFLIEDQFSLKNLEQAFKNITFVSIPNQL